MMDSGQCDCRRHFIGRRCSEVQPGYFCAPLDYYKYEAEEAAGRSPTDPSLPVSSAASPQSLLESDWDTKRFSL